MRSEMSTPVLPEQAEVRYHMEVTFRVAITPFVAQQNANVYLLMNVGNMLSAGDPILSLGVNIRTGRCRSIVLFRSLVDARRSETWPLT